MGTDKLFYLNSIETTGNALNGAMIQRNVPETEFAEMLKAGKETI